IWNANLSLPEVEGCTICSSPPGAATLYSTHGTTLLGIVIDEVGQDVYGKNFIELYEDWIQTPGGLWTLDPAFDDSDPMLADGYDENGNVLPGGWSDIGWKLPAGGFISNIVDLTEFAEGIVNNLFVTGGTLAQMSVVDNPAGGASWSCNTPDTLPIGLGFFVNQVGSSTRIYHTGQSTHGYNALLYVYPDEDAAIVLITNEMEETDRLWSIQAGIEAFVLCPENRTFTDEVDWSWPWNFQSSNEITFEAPMIGGNTTFTLDAVEGVTFLPGTHVPTGRPLKARIGGCTLD
ncbi:MAG: serine hydrolase domain-containing protein, partial [Saprospiraceae bacterium]|nr:serine hydrolase domain-containing protein [Saprospiraceae bacterium]